MTAPDRPTRPSFLWLAGATVFRWFASMQLAIALIVILGVVLAWATIIEAGQGRAFAQWTIYQSSWFCALLALLGINIVGAMVARFPWRKKIGFFVTHVGLLVLLAGSVQTFVGGIEGHVALSEGEVAQRMTITDTSRFIARWQRVPGENKPRSSALFSFKPGPVDWPDGKTLDLGKVGDVALKVLRFYAHAQIEEVYLEDPSKTAGPALRLELQGPDGARISEAWASADQSSAQLSFGPIEIRVQQAADASILEDWQKPPALDDEPDGVLAMHYKGKTYHASVSKQAGKTVPLGDTGAEVEIKEYIPDAHPGTGATFAARTKEPNNPLLELRVKLGKDQPAMRQIAFARLPMLNLDAIHGKACPVTFYFHHPKASPKPGVDFVQMPDGKLACCTGGPGHYQVQPDVKLGDAVALSPAFKVAVVKHLPHAIQEMRFHRATGGASEVENLEAAALVEVAVGDAKREIWLKRNDPELGQQLLDSPQGPLAVSFDFETEPLGFSLKLKKFNRGVNPGGMGDASFASTVELSDPVRDLEETREISMNEPLIYGRYTVYQSSFQEVPGGGAVSIFSVAHDPGLKLKYAGSLLIIFGSAMMFIGRSRFWKEMTAPTPRLPPAEGEDEAVRQTTPIPQSVQ